MFPEMSEIGFNCNICWWIFQILGTTWLWMSMTLALNVNLNHYLFQSSSIRSKLVGYRSHKSNLIDDHRVQVICNFFKWSSPAGPATVLSPERVNLWKVSWGKVKAVELDLDVEQPHQHLELLHVVLDEAAGPHPILLGLQLCQHEQLAVATPQTGPPLIFKCFCDIQPRIPVAGIFEIFIFQIFLWQVHMNLFSAMQPLLLNPHRGAISKYAEKKVSICE